MLANALEKKVKEQTHKQIKKSTNWLKNLGCGTRMLIFAQAKDTLPNFLGLVDYHISLAMGLLPRAGPKRRAWSSAIKIVIHKSVDVLNSGKALLKLGKPAECLKASFDEA